MSMSIGISYTLFIDTSKWYLYHHFPESKKEQTVYFYTIYSLQRPYLNDIASPPFAFFISSSA